VKKGESHFCQLSQKLLRVGKEKGGKRIRVELPRGNTEPQTTATEFWSRFKGGTGKKGGARERLVQAPGEKGGTIKEFPITRRTRRV